MTRQFLVPILLPADPTVALEAATKQYVDASAGGTGDQYRYDWLTATTASDPGAGKVKCNNTDQTFATAVYMSMYDGVGVAGVWLLDLVVGSRFALYEIGDINTFIRYEVTGAVTNNGPFTWFTIPVTVHEEGPSGFTPSNNQTVMLGPSRAAVAGDLLPEITAPYGFLVSGTTGGPDTPSWLSPTAGNTAFYGDNSSFGFGVVDVSSDIVSTPPGYTNLSDGPLTGVLQSIDDQIGLYAVETSGVVPGPLAMTDAYFLRSDGWQTVAGLVSEPPVGTKLTDLTALTGAVADPSDLIEAVDVSDTTMAATGTNKKMSLLELIDFLYIQGIGSLGGVPTSRIILTTLPLTGGGALTSDLELAVNAATLTTSGVVELATTAEATAQTDNVRAVTPLGLADRVPTARTITATAPVRIDGGASADLSANRTISIATDGVTNTLLATMPTLTIKGNNTGSTAGPTDLTVAQVKTMLSINEIHVGTTAPGSPATGDLWVDTT